MKHTAPQVLIRYCFQMGLSVVVRGTSPTNMEQNYNMLAFMLTDEHLKTLDRCFGFRESVCVYVFVC